MKKVCACKGVRTCLLCESADPATFDFCKAATKSYIYCDICKKASLDSGNLHPDHSQDCIPFNGINIIYDFVSEAEEKSLVDQVDETNWVDSQSGRRKQDYGPKVNFKKKKLKMSVFTGLPHLSQMLVERMSEHEELAGFRPVELCNLEYMPERGSAIDPHFDDFWIWGERLVTLNLLSRTAHTMTIDSQPDTEVIVPLPRRCLVIVTNDARYLWKHAIRRTDISSRRLAMTFRELPADYLHDGTHADVGRQLLDIAETFQGIAVGTPQSTSP